MPNSISLTATPESYPVSAESITTVTVTATVVNEHGDPARHVEVTFSSPLFNFQPATVATDHAGKAVQRLTYPLGGVITITAALHHGPSATASVFAYSPGLAQVRVTNAPHDHINQYSIKSGVQAEIPSPGKIAAGYLFDFHWGEATRQRLIESEIDGLPYGVPWVLNLKTQFAPDTVLKDGRYAVYYAVFDQAGNVAVCKPKYITVTGGDYSKLLAPVLLPASLDDKIDREAARRGVTIRIPAQPEIKAGYTYRINLNIIPGIHSHEPAETRHIASGTVSASDRAISFEITHRSGLLAGLDNVKGEFVYDIAPAGGGRITHSLPLATHIDTAGQGSLTEELAQESFGASTEESNENVSGLSTEELTQEPAKDE
ncbi:Ig-like domain-containing protein [Sodalis sp. RH16]|uniref:Ig-like domain-containing protein n=1 Tax=unclassified Sodalis (in: enterobacteria) TaxID=2636512 RepID=UPI0039B3C20A